MDNITIPNPIIIQAVRDLFIQKKIIVRIKGLPQAVLLWSGEEEYTAAGNWTNETVLTRATEVLSLSTIPWVI